MSPVETLLAVLDLAPEGPDRFAGTSLRFGPRVFGGQVIAQALVAASRTVRPGRTPHSLHAYFLLPGDPDIPIVYAVDRVRDGGSFSTRTVTAEQSGRPIFILSASFQRHDDGFDHEAELPDVPSPEDLPSDAEIAERIALDGSEAVRRYWSRPRPVVLKPADPDWYLMRRGARTRQAMWMRPAAPLPDDAAIHTAVLAYLSDMTLLDTALAVHGRSVFDADLQVPSIDHAMWFHRPPRIEDWVLYAQDSPSASGGRGFTRGLLFARDGRLLASVAQEGLMRPRG
jgi:acyl-CoA thioesterase-2